MSFFRLNLSSGRGVFKLENNLFTKVLRNGFIQLIPIVLAGSFSLTIIQFPLESVRSFLQSFLDGFILKCFSSIYNTTYGLLSLFLLISLSKTWVSVWEKNTIEILPIIVSSILCFAILAGVYTEDFSIAVFGLNGIALSILCGMSVPIIYTFFRKKTEKLFQPYTDGVIGNLNEILKSIIPMAGVVTLFILFNQVFCYVHHAQSFHISVFTYLSALLSSIKITWWSVIILLLFVNFLCFCGVPGVILFSVVYNSCLNGVFSMSNIYAFILPGGSGALLCLALAILFFGNSSMNKRYAKLSAFPMLFNINEIMLFGLPVIMNPVLVIPFILIPLVMCGIYLFFIQIGFLQVPIHDIVSTTPVLLSGYLSTGSFRGVFVQIIQLIIGTALYIPFVRMLDTQNKLRLEIYKQNLLDILEKNEKEHKNITLLNLPSETGSLARFLLKNLKKSIQNKELSMYYQLQCDNKGRKIGVEALLRWNTLEFGRMSSPLAVKLAEEGGFLTELEEYIVQTVVRDKPVIHEHLGDECRVSVNVSGCTIQLPEFEVFLKNLTDSNSILGNPIWIEITEQTELFLYDEVLERLGRIRDMGYHLVLDDFSMGCTSLHYLKSNHFDMVKLDGSLVSGITFNPRCRDIIASIIFLAYSLEFSVLAEYVETEDQIHELEDVGCTQYQGHYFGSAVPLEKLPLEKAPLGK